MGRSTIGIINKEIQADLILEVIKEKFDKNAEMTTVSYTDAYDVNDILFKVKDTNYSLFLSICGGETYGTPYKSGDLHRVLSIYSSKESIDMMKEIISVFGGYIDENDCDDIDFYEIPIKNNSKGKYVELYKETKFNELTKELNSLKEKYSDVLNLDFKVSKK